MTSFKESIIIPYSMFKSCNFEKELPSPPFREELEKNVRDYKLKRQQDLMYERMYNRKPYTVHTTYVPPILPKAQPLLKDEQDLTHDKPSSDSDLTISKILKKIPTAQKPNVRSILDKIEKNSGSWNDNGEILIKGRLIKGSDISKIMQYFSKPQKFSGREPHGIKELWDFFETIKMPRSWIRNKPMHVRKTSDSISLSKYPLEDSERERISEVLGKSKMGEVSPASDKTHLESEKLDYAGAIDPEVIDSQSDEEVLREGLFSSTPKKKSDANIDIGEIEERPPSMFRSFLSENKGGKEEDIFNISDQKKVKVKTKKSKFKPSKKDYSFPTRSSFGRIIKPSEKMKGKGLPLIWSPTLWPKVLKTSKY